MLYFVSALIIYAFFIFTRRDRRTGSKLLLGTGMLYTLAVVFIIMYLARDIRYYHVIENYFHLPRQMWRSLIFSPISKNAIIRMINIFSLSSIYMGVRFSIISSDSSVRKWQDRILRLLFILFIAEIIFFDPLFQKILYSLLCPDILSYDGYELLLGLIHSFTRFANNSAVLFSIFLLFRRKSKILTFPYFKYFAISEAVSYSLIMISFLVLFGQVPTNFIRYSKISGYTSYRSIALYAHTSIYILSSWLLLAATIVIVLSTAMLSVYAKRLKNQELTISAHIDASNTTSKAFCHYMKNELLAIEAEAKLARQSPDNYENLTMIIEKCDRLYERLDEIHRSTKASSLRLESADLYRFICSITDEMSKQLEGISVSIHSDPQIPMVLIDEHYFADALKNVIFNSIDAMEDRDEGEKNLWFDIQYIKNWVSISIKDTGKGIRTKDLQTVFEPFISSKPIARHWGVGLTVTKQIIAAHKGKISVDSREGVGTTFQILIPNLGDYVNE